MLGYVERSWLGFLPQTRPGPFPLSVDSAAGKGWGGLVAQPAPSLWWFAGPDAARTQHAPQHFTDSAEGLPHQVNPGGSVKLLQRYFARVKLVKRGGHVLVIHRGVTVATISTVPLPVSFETPPRHLVKRWATFLPGRCRRPAAALVTTGNDTGQESHGKAAR